MLRKTIKYIIFNRLKNEADLDFWTAFKMAVGRGHPGSEICARWEIGNKSISFAKQLEIENYWQNWLDDLYDDYHELDHDHFVDKFWMNWYYDIHDSDNTETNHH